MEEMRNEFIILVGKNVKGRYHLGDLGIDGIIMFYNVCTGCICLRTWTIDKLL
jgi:hypothetical protein